MFFPMKTLPNYLNKNTLTRSLYFNEFLKTKTISEFSGLPLFLKNLTIHSLIWKKIFMKRKRCSQRIIYFNFLNSKKTKTLIFSEKKIWNKYYIFYSNLNFTKLPASGKTYFTLIFYFFRKLLNFIYFLNKIQFYRILFLTISFKNFNFFKNNFNRPYQSLISFNSKFI
jgi:hypothetical protein